MATHGTATISAGDTSVLVHHTLGSTSTSYKVALGNLDDLNGRSIFVNEKGVASFKINISSQDLADHQFKWVIV
jgi:hypothetical protein